MAVPDHRRRRSLPQQYYIHMNMLVQDEVPSDEEAQDSTPRRKEMILLDSSPENQRRRRRSQSLSRDAALPGIIASPCVLSGYESEPSDLSSASSEHGELDAIIRQAHRRVREGESELALDCCAAPSTNTSRHCRKWPFRFLLLACAYIAWTTDTFLMSERDDFLVQKRAIPKAAFSSQHGREVPIIPMEQHSPLREMEKRTFIPPTTKKKRRPQVALALASNQKAPVLGQRREMERFVMDENGHAEETSTTILTTSTQHHSSLYWLGYVALLLLFVETGVREVRRRTCSRQQRLRNE